MISELETYLTDKLRTMQEEKEKGTVVPKWVTKGCFLGAVDKDIRAALNNMFKEGKIRVHKTKDAQSQDYIELVKKD